MPNIDWSKKLLDVNSAFSPSTPISEKDLFIGRIELIQSLIDAIVEPGQHAVLYGLRGVGKTSLANVIHQWLGDKVLFTQRVNCNRQDTFRSLWTKMFDSIKYGVKHPTAGFLAKPEVKLRTLAETLPKDQSDLNPSVVAKVLVSMNAFMLLIFDEFDTVTDADSRAAFADLLKELSDSAAYPTVLIVGIGKTVTDLVGNHPSVERCMKQIQMSPMSEDELEGIIDKGLTLLEMSIPAKLKSRVVSLSMGFPHYTHLLAKSATKNAIQRQSLSVADQDLELAISGAIRDANHTIKELFRKAVMSSKKNTQFKRVLFACAAAQRDLENPFKTADVVDVYSRLFGDGVRIRDQAFTYHIGKFCSEERGPILEKIGRGKVIGYRFISPLVMAYVRLVMTQEEGDLFVQL